MQTKNADFTKGIYDGINRHDIIQKPQSKLLSFISFDVKRIESCL